eukprot:400421_1
MLQNSKILMHITNRNNDVLQIELNTNSSGIGILSSTYSLTNFLFQLPFGIILQKYSHHMILLIISICLTICFILFIFTESLTYACIIRAICGIFGSSTWILVVTIIGQHFGNNKISLFSGITLSVTQFIWLLGLTFQGYIYETYHMWRITYYICGFIGIISLSAVIITMYTQKKAIEKNKLTAVNISWVQLFNENDSPRAEQIDISETENINIANANKLKLVMKNYLNICIAFYAFVAWALGKSIFGLWLIPYLMVKFNYSRLFSSFLLGICWLACGFGNLLFGYFATKYRNRRIYLMICALLLSTFLYLIYLDEKILNEYIVIIMILLVGCGNGYNGILFTLIREYNVSENCEETATGFVSAVQSLSGFVSQYVIGLLIDYHWELRNVNVNSEVRIYNVSDYTFAFSCIGIPCLIVLVISTILLKETNGKGI